MKYSQMINARPGLLAIMGYDIAWDKKIDMYELIKSLDSDLGLIESEIKRLHGEYISSYEKDENSSKPVYRDGKSEEQYNAAINALVVKECPKKYKKIYLYGNDFPGNSPTVDEMIQVIDFVEFKKSVKGKSV